MGSAGESQEALSILQVSVIRLEQIKYIDILKSSLGIEKIPRKISFHLPSLLHSVIKQSPVM